MATSAAKFICFLIIMGLAVPSLANDYYIGGLVGWGPVAALAQWIAGKNFAVGDVLHFVSFPPVPVYLVTADNYAFCNSNGAIQADFSGNFVYKLNQSGNYYFISSYAKCILGLKLAINVPAK